MAQATANTILHFLRDACTDVGADAELLDRFLAERDERAFETLVRRHGPMVLDICRARLANEADAEDAFQTTFFVLARNARSIRKAASLASWLHGVAIRIALQTQTERARKLKHEPRAAGPVAIAQQDDLSWREVQQILHEEVNRLPERLRAPLVLCYLQGVGHEQAALELGLPKGTLKGRLERARERLRVRLTRRGLGAGALLVIVWPASAALPLHLAGSTAIAAKALVHLTTAPIAAHTQALKAAAERYAVSRTWSKITALTLVVAVGLGAYLMSVRTQKDLPVAVAVNPPAPFQSSLPAARSGDEKQSNSSVVSDSRVLGEFTRIQILRPVRITVRTADRCSVVIADRAKTIARIEDGILTLGNEDAELVDANGIETIECTIEIKTLTEITMVGVGITQITGIEEKELAISVMGAGSLIATGKLESLELNIVGIGGFDGQALRAESVRIAHSGLADILVNVGKRLDATLTGLGSVQYLGSPEVRQEVVGFGQVIPRRE